MQTRKHVLLITYYWPPAGGSGVQRWMYFAKYLKEFGCELTVITVDPKFASYSSIDESLLEHVKGIEVHKTKTFELIRLYSFLKSGNSKKSIPQGNVGGKKKSFLDKFSSYVRANYFIPDARVGWNPYVISKANELFKKQKFDTVITTGPPHSTHLVGLKLKEKHQFKWIADFRDPWTEVYYNDIFKRTRKNQQKDEKLELSVLQKADTILTIGPSMKDLLAKKVNSNKIEFVYNGFDEIKMKKIKPNKKKNFTIAHIGLLTEKQSYLSLIKGLKRTFEKYQDFEVELIIAGEVSASILEKFYEIKELKTSYIGKIKHDIALQLMFDVHLLVNCLAMLKESKILISGKLMEYLATGNPILLIGDKDGDAAKLLENNSVNLTVEINEIEEIVDFLYQNFKNSNNFKTSNFDMSAFSRLETTKKIMNLI